MMDFSASYTDDYELTMAQVYFLKGQTESRAVFDYFFRKLPFNGGYAVFAGLDTLLDVLENWYFTEEDLTFLQQHGFNKDFIHYLGSFRFHGDVYSTSEGDVVFPTRPVLEVEAGILEAQIIETVLLNILNFQTLIATKASRMRQVAGHRVLVDFGLRRAQGVGGYHASRAAVIGGFDATSNVRAGMDFDIPVSGTMAHSFIESYDDELTAFRDFASCYPDNCVLLVDTYNTLKSGLPNAIRVGKEMEKQGKKLSGIRLDSGDLAYMARESRRMLDDAGLDYVKIAVSNQLDEYIIKSLLEQGAPVDYFGVGTSLVTGGPDAAIDGVYKLAYAAGEPRLKLSESKTKMTLPYRKQVFRVRQSDGNLIGADVITLRDEEHVERMHHVFESRKSLSFPGCQLEPLMHMVMKNGKRLYPPKALATIRDDSLKRIDELPLEYKRFENPHIYKIGLSDKLREERDQLIEQLKK
jgi:nicotinate phosphoribosyltransferase